MEKSNYNKRLKHYAREHRNEGTKGEAVLWKLALRANQTGYQFNRQYPLGNYIVDFVCRKLKLAIEVDGNSHFRMKNAECDSKKQNYLESIGFTVMRIEEKMILRRIDDVIKDISYTIEALKSDD